MKKIILSAALAFIAIGAFAQATEGTITYEMSADGLPPEQAAMVSGSELKMYFKGEKSRTEFNNAFVSTTTVKDDKKIVTLMDIMGQKKYMEVTADEAKKMEGKSPEPKIEYKDETKKIAGYDCKKAIITRKNEKGESSTSTVWYTEKIPYKGQGKSKGSAGFGALKGAPLEFEMEMGPMKAKLVATEVSMGAVSDSKFVANTEGYVKMSKEEMEKQMGGGK
ncbi:MAG: hypothetical protein K0S33_380 [Bacteroidetes bacterium]|jgi:GLPGLI family protein|nr:hypothetical protein [Bacteroidota bacterium]